MIETGISLTEEEKKDFFLVLDSLNLSNEYLVRTPSVDLSEEEFRAYLTGICKVYIEARVNEHMWRKDISQRYDIPYDFVCRRGDILLQEDTQDQSNNKEV